MATKNRKDNHFFFAVFHLFSSFSRVSLGKISWNLAVLPKRFGTILKFENMKNLSRGFLKILQFPIFHWKKRSPQIRFCSKIILWSRHLYHEVCKLSQNSTEGNTRKVSACFLRLHGCDVIQFREDHALMPIRGPLAPLRVRNSNSEVNPFELWCPCPT